MTRKTIAPGDAEYPPDLHGIDDPPTLRVAGAWPSGPCVAVVGTRHPTGAAVGFTRRLASELTERGVVVVSGGALGIDAAAHAGALDAGGPTVAVLPAGLDQTFPPEHAPLFARVLEGGGALVSPFLDAVPATLGSFFRRNAVLSALSRALIVTECPARSGARNAAKAARRQSKPVGVVLHAPWELGGFGAMAELRLGARPVATARDVLALAGLERAAASAGGDASQLGLPYAAPLAEPERRVVMAVASGAAHVDALCDALALPAGEVTAAVVGLLLRGVLVEGPRGLGVAPCGPGARAR